MSFGQFRRSSDVERRTLLADLRFYMRMRPVTRSVVVCVTAALLLAASTAAAEPQSPLVRAAKAQKFAAVRSLLKSNGDPRAAEADGTTALHWAAHWDNIDAVNLLLDAGAPVNARTDYGVTALTLAAENGSARVIERLLRAGADPNLPTLTDETPLMLAARSGSADAVQALVTAGANANHREKVRGQSALMWAAGRNQGDVVRVLARSGAEVDARSTRGFTALMFAAREGGVMAARALREAGANIEGTLPDGTTPLLAAVASGQAAVAQYLLEQGANPNAADANGLTPLHAAFFRQAANPQIVGALLAHGANPSARLKKGPETLPSEIGSYAGLAGATPFLMAARRLDAPMMKALVDAGADPKAVTDNGATALMLAAGLGRFLTEGRRSAADDTRMMAAVNFALDHGVDVNAATTRGETAVHAAAITSADAVITLLAAKGAALQATDRNGRTPRTAAELAVRDGGSPTTVELLRKLGG